MSLEAWIKSWYQGGTMGLDIDPKTGRGTLYPLNRLNLRRNSSNISKFEFDDNLFRKESASDRTVNFDGLSGLADDKRKELSSRVQESSSLSSSSSSCAVASDSSTSSSVVPSSEHVHSSDFDQPESKRPKLQQRQQQQQQQSSASFSTSTAAAAAASVASSSSSASASASPSSSLSSSSCSSSEAQVAPAVASADELLHLDHLELSWYVYEPRSGVKRTDELTLNHLHQLWQRKLITAATKVWAHNVTPSWIGIRRIPRLLHELTAKAQELEEAKQNPGGG